MSKTRTETMTSPVLQHNEFQQDVQEPPAPSTTEEEIPQTGYLTPLKTPLEIRAALETVDAYIMAIPSKTASEVINALRPVVPQMDLQHLRRLARPAYLPQAVVATLPPPDFPREMSVLYLLVCAANKARPQDIIRLAAGTSAFRPRRPHFRPPTPRLAIVKVPANVPTSPQQAEEWTARLWPTVYKRGNPFGPHPAIIENSTAKQKRVGEYMAVARAVGFEAAANGNGHPFGAVIVNPKTGDILAAAGDSRFCKHDGKQWSNPLNHAILRLVAMVAQKRLAEGVAVAPNNPLTNLTETEQRYINVPTGEEEPSTSRTASPETPKAEDSEETVVTKSREKDKLGGYLCHNMHVYATHEPCVMCSMALLHSRVGAVIFEQKMPQTGALTGDVINSQGYGLFWRPDLNWKYLCWQWTENDPTPEIPGLGHLQV